MKTARITLAVLGLAAIGYALLGAAGDPDINPSRHTGFLVTVLVLNDGILIPLVIAAGVLVHRFVPPSHGAILQAALLATTTLTAVAAPLVLGYGRIADNPSALPRDYAHGLATVLVLIWLTTAIGLLVRSRFLRVRSRLPSPGHGPT
jgi:hypothetical protein